MSRLKNYYQDEYGDEWDTEMNKANDGETD